MPNKVVIDGEEYVKVPKVTDIHFLLDKSGSMAPTADATLEAFNGYISELKADKNKYRVTLTLFDTVSSVLWEQENPPKLPQTTPEGALEDPDLAVLLGLSDLPLSGPTRPSQATAPPSSQKGSTT